jgi:AcrR family transcriptional regulator
MPRPPLSADQRAETRREIAAVAFDLFARGGYEVVNVDEIAVAAGISLRTFYRYFGSKEDVLDPLLAEGVHDLIYAFSTRPQDEDPFESAIAAYRETVGADGFDDEFVVRMVQLLSSVPALRARWLDRQRASEELLADQIRVRLPAGTTELEVRGRAAMIVLALRLPLEMAASGNLEGGIRETSEGLLHALAEGSFSQGSGRARRTAH